MKIAAQPPYRELPPPPALADRLLCLWVRRVSGDAGRSCAVLPDGCVDIVYIGDDAPMVAGPATRTMTVGLTAGTTVIGARFRPGWAADSLGMNAAELRDRNLPLADMPGSLAARFGSPVVDAAIPADKLHRLSAALQEHYAGRPPVDPLIRLCAAWLVRHPAGRLRDLAREVGIGERRLHRHFSTAIGYAPKTFQRIMRVQRLRWLCGRHRHAPLSLAVLAQQAGYADQSHMCREVASLAGITPGRLQAGDDGEIALSDMFNTAGPA